MNSEISSQNYFEKSSENVSKSQYREKVYFSKEDFSLFRSNTTSTNDNNVSSSTYDLKIPTSNNVLNDYQHFNKYVNVHNGIETVDKISNLPQLPEKNKLEEKLIEKIDNSDNSIFSNDNLKSSKTFFRKCKKSVDTLLEQLKNCNKKSNTIDVNIGSNVGEKIEKGIYNSLYPNHCKSKSVHCTNDIILPICGYDDSNESKQRRKRKLGKPLKLTKDTKLEKEDMNPLGSKLFLQGKNDLTEYSIHSHQVSFNSNSLSNLSEKANTSYNLKTQDSNNISKFSLQSNVKNIFDYQLEKRCDNRQQDLADTLHNVKYLRSRRKSECSTQLSNKKFEIRRKSCSDINECFCRSITEKNKVGNVELNEVESQLEKMFAGLIESDKETHKKSENNTNKCPSDSQSDNQKNHLNTEKILNNIFLNDSLCQPDKKSIVDRKKIKKKILEGKTKSNDFISDEKRGKRKSFNLKQLVLQSKIKKKKKNESMSYDT